ncbi:MAG: hypothetical protein H7210_06215 [Pyrinomonadaceae bacterium]|nr:hypothetical protein [Phycisphaerales bacterium]
MAPTGGLIISSIGELTFVNNILWGNRGTQAFTSLQQINGFDWDSSTIDSCCIQGWSTRLPGTHVINTNPLFVSLLGADGAPATGDEDLRLSVGSPCVNTGDTSQLPADVADVDHDGNRLEQLPVDLAGRVRVSGQRVDMGVYELTAGLCSADFSGDGLVNSLDFFDYLAAFFALLPTSDFDGSGTVDSVDLFGFIGVWMSGC